MALPEILQVQIAIFGSASRSQMPFLKKNCPKVGHFSTYLTLYTIITLTLWTVSPLSAQKCAKCPIFEVFGPKVGHFDFFQKSKRMFIRTIAIANTKPKMMLILQIVFSVFKSKFFQVFWPKVGHFEFFHEKKKSSSAQLWFLQCLKVS